MPAEVVRNQYDERWAENYEHWHSTKHRWRHEQSVVRDLLANAHGTLLDIPVGTGRFAHIYKALPVDVLGMDTSEAMMAKATERGIECYKGDILEIMLPNQSIDYSVCIRLLNHLSEDEMLRAMAELLRVTRRVCIVSVHLGEPYDTGHNWRIFTPELFEQAVGSRHMTTIEIDRKDNGCPYVIARIQC